MSEMFSDLQCWYDNCPLAGESGANLCHCGLIKYINGFSGIDECKRNYSCHVNATCKNTDGSYVCECHPGFNGNGQNCSNEFNLFATSLMKSALH